MSLNNLAAMAVAAIMFIQFRNPADDSLLFECDSLGAPVLDAQGNKKPIGVRCFSPGSREYRKAEAKIATENIRAGRKGLNGAKLQANQIELLAATVTEYVNFEYEGAGASLENNRKLFEDVRYVAVRDQIAEKQADLGNSSLTPSSV